MKYHYLVRSNMLSMVLLIGLCAAQPIFAQTTVITYQGKLEFSGVPANGDFDFQFKLFDVATNGAQQGATLEQLNITVANGAYSVNLDFGAAVFTGADRFLEVSQRPAGGGAYTTLTPRQLVTSTPYSVRSLVATSADGLSATCTNCVTSSQIQNVQGGQISGTIPVGSVPAGSASYIQNTLSQQPSSNFSISGSGAAAGTLSANVMNAATQYNIASARVLGVSGSSIFVGVNSGSFNSGSDNAFFGRNTGVINSTGSNNSFLGSSAGFNNTTGNDNTFVGSHAGRSNTSGLSGVFIGKEAGYSNTTGFQNIFIGSGAGYSNTTGFFNLFIGSSAGRSNTTGYDNSFFGDHAGFVNTTGTSNVFFGTVAGAANTTGSHNGFFGMGAGNSNTTGTSNVFLGSSTGFANTTGNYNVFLGAVAGGDNTTGMRNTFVGYDADFATANPTGDNNTLLGYNTRVNSGVSNSTAIGASAQVTASNTIVVGTSSETVIVRGKLQVDTLGTAGSQQVCLNGSNRLAPCSSSLRYKTDLKPFAGGLAIINRLEPISFTWKDGGRRDVGFGAEAVERVEPLFVVYNTDGQVEGVKYDRITVALVNAIKEQQRQIADLSPLQAENAKLKAQLADILTRLEQLEKQQAGQK